MKQLLLLGALFVASHLAYSQTNLVQQLVDKHKSQLGAWAQNPDQYEIQVIYTQIDRDENNQPSFTSHHWKVDPERYFYPASTVKMPTAFMALEKMNKLGIFGLHMETPMRTFAYSPPQTAALVDTLTYNQLPTIGNYIRKIFLVSDNDAYNRLYEFLGQRYLNEALHEKGYTDSRIIHRLSVSGFDTLGNQYTNPCQFFDPINGALIYHQGEVRSKFYPEKEWQGQVRGKGYFDDDSKQVVNEPFDFRYKNAVSLENLHDILQAVLFPMAVPASARFELTENQLRMLYYAMYDFPSDAHDHWNEKPDNYVKFWMFGDSTQSIPDHIRIFNKVGWAYGFLTDVAYIVDFEAGVEFMLAGVIHVNKNEIFNDGEYEYESIGLPFFAELGQLIYDFERKRPRKHKPDLSRFKMR